MTKKQQYFLSKLFGILSNPKRIEILEEMSRKGSCIKDEIIELDGISSFSIGTNLKYLKKFELITGSISSRNLSYCINYKKLDEFKNNFDLFYESINQFRDQQNVINCKKS